MNDESVDSDGMTTSQRQSFDPWINAVNQQDTNLNNSKIPNINAIMVTREDSSKQIQQQILNNIKGIEQRIKIEKRKKEFEKEIKSIKSKNDSSNGKKSAEQSSKNDSNDQQIDMLKLKSTPSDESVNNALIQLKNVESGSANGGAFTFEKEEKDGISKALDIIETHEKEQLAQKRQKKELDQMKLQSIEENFQNEIEPRKTLIDRENLSFSQSAILVCSDPDNNSNIETNDDLSNPKEHSGPDQNEFEIQEETALLIESIMHPQYDMDPENIDQNGKSMVDWDMDKFIQNGFSDQRYNIYGQRYHPNASPYEFQHGAKRNTNAYSNLGTQGFAPSNHPIPYENRYILLEDSQQFYYEESPHGHNFIPEQGHGPYDLYQKQQLDEIRNNKHLHYLNDSENGLNTKHHTDFAKNQMVLQGLRNMYEDQGAGIASNTMTFFKIQRNLFGFGLLIAPFCIKEVGIELFAIGLSFTCLINVFTIWLLSKAEKRFRNEFFMITNLHDLTYLCFGDWVIVLQQIMRVLQCLILLIVINLYLSIQTDQMMCQTIKGYQCNKSRDYFIRIAVNILIILIILSGNAYQLRFRKMVSVFSSLLMFIAIGLILFHAYISFKFQSQQEKNETLNMINIFGKNANDTSDNVTLPIQVQNANLNSSKTSTANYHEEGHLSQFFKFCSFVSIAMTLFDGNYHILLVKNEMSKPHDFTKIAISSVTIFSAISFLVGFISYLGMGSKMLIPITEIGEGDYQILGSKVFMIDSNVLFYLKLLCIACMFASVFLYSMNIFISLQKINRILTQDRRNMNQFVQNANQALSFNTIKSDDFMSKSQHGNGSINTFVQFLILTCVVVASNRLSQNLDDDKTRINRSVQLTMQICGGLIGTVMLILFPILIFNKSYRQSQNYKGLIVFNWLLFATSIVIGGIGCYFGYVNLYSNMTKAATTAVAGTGKMATAH